MKLAKQQIHSRGKFEDRLFLECRAQLGQQLRQLIWWKLAKKFTPLGDQPSTESQLKLHRQLRDEL